MFLSSENIYTVISMVWGCTKNDLKSSTYRFFLKICCENKSLQFFWRLCLIISNEKFVGKSMIVKRRSTATKKKSKPKKNGRPSIYTKKTARHICRELCKGRTVVSILKDEGMPSIPTMYNWLNKFSTAFQPEFLEAYTTAREIQAEIYADEIKDIADDGSNDTYEVLNEKTGKMETKVDYDHIKRSALRVESRKWLAAHLLPRKFSDRMQVTGADGKDLIPSTPTKVVFNFIKSNKEEEND